MGEINWISIVKDLTTERDYETEYDGRMESYCFFCGHYAESSRPHPNGCGYSQAKAALDAHNRDTRDRQDIHDRLRYLVSERSTTEASQVSEVFRLVRRLVEL